MRKGAVDGMTPLMHAAVRGPRRGYPAFWLPMELPSMAVDSGGNSALIHAALRGRDEHSGDSLGSWRQG